MFIKRRIKDHFDSRSVKDLGFQDTAQLLLCECGIMGGKRDLSSDNQPDWFMLCLLYSINPIYLLINQYASFLGVVFFVCLDWFLLV